MIGLLDLATWVPETTVDNLHEAARHGYKETFVRQKLGILQRPVLGPDQTVADMAVEAVSRLLARHADLREKIQALVIVTQNPDFRLPTTANLVQDRAGLPKTCAAFDLNQGCSGYVYGLAVLSSLMEASAYDYGILVTSENYTRIVNPNDRNTALLFADGASATLLKRNGGAFRLGRFVLGGDGAGGDRLILEAGGSRYPDRTAGGRDGIFMDGRAIFEFSQKVVPGCVDDCLALNGLGRDAVGLYLFHQASRFMLETLRQRLGIAAERLPIDLEKTGNTVSSTIPILIEHLGGLSALAGRNHLLCGFGVGFSWGAVTIFSNGNAAQ